MTSSEIIFHRRVRVLEHAAKTTVAEASRVLGVSRKTIYDWKRLAESYGLVALMTGVSYRGWHAYVQVSAGVGGGT